MFHPRLIYQLTFEGSWPTAVSFLDSARSVAAGNQEGELLIWELPEQPPEPAPAKEGNKTPPAPNVAPTRRLAGHTNAIARLLFAATRRQLLSASYDHTLRIWSLDSAPTGTTQVVLDRQARESEYRRTKREETLRAPGVELPTYAPQRTLEAHSDWILTLAASGDGKRWISGDAAAHVVVWDAEQAAPLAQWRGHAWNWIVAARLAPDGQTAVVSEFRYKRDDFDIPTAAFKIWAVADQSERLDILKVQFPKLKADETSYGAAQPWRKFLADGLVALAYSPDGQLIAAGQGGETDTGKAHVVDAASGQVLRTISGHQYGMTDLCFSRDGTLLFTAGRDTCVRIVRVADGQELAVLGAPRGGQFKDWISAIALSPDEQYLAAADIAGHVAVWRLNAE